MPLIPHVQAWAQQANACDTSQNVADLTPSHDVISTKRIASCLLQLLDGIAQPLTCTLVCVPSATLAAKTKLNFLFLPDAQLLRQHGPHRQCCLNLRLWSSLAGIEGNWSLPGLALPQSPSFKYLGLDLHERRGWAPCCVTCILQARVLGPSFRPTKAGWHHLRAHAAEASLSVLGAPAISYGYEVQGPQLHGRLDADARRLQGIQFRFLRNGRGRLPVGIAMPAILDGVAQDPCTLIWFVELVRFAVRVSDVPLGSLYHGFMRDNILRAFFRPSMDNWAAQVIKHVRSLGLPAPLTRNGILFSDKFSLRTDLAGKHHKVWQELHAS